MSDLERQIRIVDPSAKVYFEPLLIGASGTLYASTISFLEELGVKKSALNQCKKDLHIAAVKSLYSIYTTKRKKEQALEHQRGYMHRRKGRR